jgi:hypothetical protein
MTTVGAGLSAQLGIAQETTPGTPVTVTRFYEFDSETMQQEKKTVQGVGLRAGGLFERSSRRVIGSWGAKGNIVMDFPMHKAGLLLQQMMGSFGATATAQGASAAYLQTHAPGSLAGKTFTMQVGKPTSGGTVEPFTYPGCKVTDWQLDCKLNEILKLTVGVDAWQELTTGNPQNYASAGPALATASYTSGEAFFHFAQGTIYNGGTLATSSGVTTLSSPTAAAKVSAASIKVTNPLDVNRFFIGSTGGGSSVGAVKGEQLENDFRKISGTLDVEFADLTSFYNTYAGDTTSTLELLFTGPTIASTYDYTLSVLIPLIVYDGESPKVPGPGILTMAMPFEGLDNETDNQIQIQYQTTDTTV